MDVREKLVELLQDGDNPVWGWFPNNETMIQLADYLIAHSVTVQEHGYWETAVEVRDNTVCGNGIKIEYKRCSCCKNPAKFLEDNFCGRCGAKLDLQETQKGD